MEVHHHPDLHHEKKKIKEYLLEFVMIFLAVTLGFFAETIRESISERHRENDYIVGLVNNVQNDISELKGLISRNDAELKGIDSLLRVSKENLSRTVGQDSFYYYGDAVYAAGKNVKTADYSVLRLFTRACRRQDYPR